MTVKEQIELNIVSVMKENSVILASDNFILNNNCGKVSFNLDVSLNISHSEEFRNNLEKLIDCDSPIADDGYAGGEISDLHSEVFYYKVLHNFVFIENREVSLKISKRKLKELDLSKANSKQLKTKQYTDKKKEKLNYIFPSRIIGSYNFYIIKFENTNNFKSTT
jgi:hypothetical protein